MPDSVLLDMFSVKVRSGLWALASSYRLFPRSQFEYVIAVSLMPDIAEDVLKRCAEDFIDGWLPPYSVEHPSPYDGDEPDALLALLQEQIHDEPDTTDALELAIAFSIRAGLLVPVVAEERCDFSDTGLFSESEAFEYWPRAVTADVEQLAATTRNPDYAAKMLGYDRKMFGDLVHAMKDDLRLRGDDNVLWHDNGDVEFKKRIIGNMHDYVR